MAMASPAGRITLPPPDQCDLPPSYGIPRSFNSLRQAVPRRFQDLEPQKGALQPGGRDLRNSKLVQNVLLAQRFEAGDRLTLNTVQKKLRRRLADGAPT